MAAKPRRARGHSWGIDCVLIRSSAFRAAHRASIHFYAIAATWLLVCSLAVAQEDVGLESTEALDFPQPVEPVEAARDWRFRVGALSALGQTFDGSDHRRLSVVPLLRVSWRNRAVFRGRSLQLSLYRNDGFSFGPHVQTRGGRNENREAALRGLGDLDRAFEFGGFLAMKRGPWSFRVDGGADVSGAHGGAVVETEVSLEVPFERPLFRIAVTSTVADDNFVQSYFGVTPVQAQRSGLRAFDADGGIKDVGVRIGTRVPLTRGFSGVLSAGYTRLTGDAADSPIVEDIGNPNQFFLALGVQFDF